MATTTPMIVTLDLTKSETQLERDEGYRQHPYRDSKGILTIGIGFNLEADGLSLDESRLVLKYRLWKRYLALITALPWVKYLDDARQGVLLNMAYNMGVTDVLTFRTLLPLIQAGQWDKAADDMASTEWHKEVGARAVRLEQQMRTGVWQ